MNKLSPREKEVAVYIANGISTNDIAKKLFSFGESSIFLINSRENNLVSAKLSQISIENQFYISNADSKSRHLL